MHNLRRWQVLCRRRRLHSVPPWHVLPRCGCIVHPVSRGLLRGCFWLLNACVFWPVQSRAVWAQPRCHFRHV